MIKKTFLTRFLLPVFILISSISSHSAYADRWGDDSSLKGTSNSIFGDTISNTDLRKGNVDMDTIPKAIVGIIEWLLAVAGTLSVCALIYHAVQMQLNSGITGDASGVDKAKKGMFGALIGFVISLLSWFLVTRLADILAGMSGGA